MPDDSTFIIDDDDRYSRLRLIGWWDQNLLRNAKVLVVGAGALGNEVLKNLALLGIGEVLVIDFDTIESSNLSRSVLFRAEDSGQPKADVAARRSMELNPDVKVTPISGNVITDLGLGVFRNVNCVIGCLDNREARLWVNRCCWKTTTPWIDGGIQEINGVTKVFMPPDGACYECAMTERDYQLINLRYSCPLLRREDMLAGKVPTAPTIASIIAGMQVQEALKLIHSLPTVDGAAHVFNGAASTLYTTRFTHREDCLSHETWPEPTVLEMSVDAPAKELFAVAAEQLGCGSEEVTLHLVRDLVTQLHFDDGSSRPVLKPQQLVSMHDAKHEDGSVGTPSLVHQVEATDPLADHTLATLGVAPFDEVQVTGGGNTAYFQLAADKSRFFG